MYHDVLCVVFFKQKTAYELRISDWSSDVCSSDLGGRLSAVGRDRHACRVVAQPRTGEHDWLTGAIEPGPAAGRPSRSKSCGISPGSISTCCAFSTRYSPRAACRPDRKSTRLNSSH